MTEFSFTDAKRELAIATLAGYLCESVFRLQDPVTVEMSRSHAEKMVNLLDWSNLLKWNDTAESIVRAFVAENRGLLEDLQAIEGLEKTHRLTKHEPSNDCNDA